jgi:mono/diheme cytochrome c family protein
MKRLAMTALMLLAQASAPVMAVELAGQVEDGRRIARAICAECHLVEGSGKPGAPAASFAAIAAMPSTTSVAIKVFLKTTHGNMPDIILSEAEIDALAAFILSLRQR